MGLLTEAFFVCFYDFWARPMVIHHAPRRNQRGHYILKVSGPVLMGERWPINVIDNGGEM